MNPCQIKVFKDFLKTVVKFKLKRLTTLLQFHGLCRLVGQLALKGALP